MVQNAASWPGRGWDWFVPWGRVMSLGTPLSFLGCCEPGQAMAEPWAELRDGEIIQISAKEIPALLTGDIYSI